MVKYKNVHLHKKIRRHKNMQKFRLISKQELEKVNPKLSVRYGTLNQIDSGSFMENEDGEKQYHISLKDGCNKYKTFGMLAQIGKCAKEAWNADCIYYLGVKIA